MARTSGNENINAIGIIREEDFSAIMAQAFATYGLSVVTDRALPDARDGLKPVQRRILAGMREARYLSSRPTVKSAEVVGLILGNYHPHGDASVYDAAARMAQPFTLRYPLIEGQGNMGSEDGDAPAAYRYTEMRLSPLAEALMADIERDTVPLHPTYKQDPKVQEPDYLPGRIPPVVNASSGIAVGLATNIPPHNLTEVLRACIALLDRPAMSVEQLMGYIQGPDFSQGGRVMGIDGITSYLSTGKGRIIVRAEVRIEETPRSRALIVTQLPPIGRDKVKDSIARAINARKLEGVIDMRDESDTEKGTRIVLELRKDADAAQSLSQCYSETDLQISQSFQMVYLFGESMQAARQPKQVGMIELLNYWNLHQIDVLTRRAQFDLRKAQERLHLVEGLIIGSGHAEEIVRIFQQAEDRAAARKTIEERYTLTVTQSDVISSMTLAQVTRLDSSKYASEKIELETRISELQALLNDRKALITLLKKEMQQLIKQFGDERRTIIDGERLANEPVTEVASLHEREPLTVAMTRQGALKALPVGTFALKGKAGEASYTPVRGDEQLRQVVSTTSQDYLLCVASSGRVFQIAAHSIPEGTRSAKGEPLRRLLRGLEAREEIVSVLSVESYDEVRYLVMFSKLGKVKKSPLSEYKTADLDGLQDMKLAEGDAVINALISRGQGEYFVTSDNAQTLRFSDEVVRAQGRVGQGVAAITLGPKAEVVSAVYLDSELQSTVTDPLSLLVVTRNGYSKKVLLNEYPQKGRATAGVITTELLDSDRVSQAIIIAEHEHFLFTWSGESGDQTQALKASELKIFPRARKGIELRQGTLLEIVRLESGPIEE
ncbi:MAG TPA: DNA gyrase subunit A [Ktedonobacteraceae bacterium]